MSKPNDLSGLIDHSSSTREYFLSLSVETQMLLHQSGGEIRNAEQLRRYVDLLERHNRFLINTGHKSLGTEYGGLYN